MVNIEIKQTSEVKGVCWVPSHKVWLARDIHKRTLCRSKDKKEAETARLAYDVLRKQGKIHEKPKYKTTNIRDKFKKVAQPTWPSSQM